MTSRTSTRRSTPPSARTPRWSVARKSVTTPRSAPRRASRRTPPSTTTSARSPCSSARTASSSSRRPPIWRNYRCVILRDSPTEHSRTFLVCACGIACSPIYRRCARRVLGATPNLPWFSLANCNPESVLSEYD